MDFTPHRLLISSLAPCVLAWAPAVAPGRPCEEPPVPGAEEPLGESTANLPSTMEEVRRAFDGNDWKPALEGARALLREAREKGRVLPPRDEAWLHYARSRSAFFLDLPEEALAAARDCRTAADPAWKSYEGWILSATRAAGEALLRLGRTEEAGSEIAYLVRNFPDSGRDSRLKDLAAALQATEGGRVVRSYEGRFASDPRVGGALDLLADRLPVAMARIRERLGGPQVQLPRIAVVLDDDLGSGHMAQAATWRCGDGWVARIEIRAAAAVSGEATTETTLVHELLHAARRANRNLRPCPPWVEEGLAHWAEEEGEDRMWRRFLAFADVTRGGFDAGEWAGRLVTGPPWEERPEQEQRMLGWLLFRHLERTRGVEAVRKFALTGTAGREASEAAFGAAFGVEPAVARKELAKAFPRWAKESLPGIDWLPLLSLLSVSPDPKPFDTAYASFIESFRSSRLVPSARIATVHWLLGRGRTEAAEAEVAELRRSDLPHSEFGAALAVLEVGLDSARKDDAAVIRRGRAVLHDFPMLEGPAGRPLRTMMAAAAIRIASLAPGPGFPAGFGESR